MKNDASSFNGFLLDWPFTTRRSLRKCRRRTCGRKTACSTLNTREYFGRSTRACSSWWFLLNVNSLPYRGHEYRTKGNATKVASTVHPDDINEKFNFLGSRYRAARNFYDREEIFRPIGSRFFLDENLLMPFEYFRFTFSQRLTINILPTKLNFSIYSNYNLNEIKNEEYIFVTYSSTWNSMLEISRFLIVIKSQEIYVWKLTKIS